MEPARRLIFVVGIVTGLGLPAQCQYPYVISTVAGTYPLGDGGPATAALLLSPQAAVVDGAGNLYIADQGNSRIRRVNAAGVITTLPGADNVWASSLALDGSGNLYIGSGCRVWKYTAAGTLAAVVGTGTCGWTGDSAPATQARVGNVWALAVDSQGNLYLADIDNHRVRKVDPAGIITTFAGTGTKGFSGDNGPAIAAQVDGPAGVAADDAGNVYITDRSNHRIRKVAPSGVITTFAGTGSCDYAGDGGPAKDAKLCWPAGLAVDRQGNLYIADEYYSRVRRVTPGGTISTVAGTGINGFGGDGGLATVAMLFAPHSVALDTRGRLYITDQRNDRIRSVADGVITTVAGASHFAGDGGPATSALLCYPIDVALDGVGNLYIADDCNHRVRRIGRDGTITTAAGNGTYGYSGDGGPATAAALRWARGVATDPEGNVFVSMFQVVRKVTPLGIISTAVGREGYGYGGDGGSATAALLWEPNGLVMDDAGNLFIADMLNHRVRKVTPGGTISTYAGTGTAGYGGDGGQARLAQLNNPRALALDSSGNLYIADQNNYRIRKVAPSGVISTVAGSGGYGSAGDGGPATAAQLTSPRGVAVDASGNLYIALPDVIRKVSAAGIITTIAGGQRGFGGDGGLATSATLDNPEGITVDRSGIVYFADHNNHRIRKLTPNAPAVLTIVSGNNQSGPVGTTLPGALIVKVMGSAGLPVPGATVTFAVTSGSATLSLTSTATDAAGQAGIQVTLGSTAGPVTVSVSVGGLPVVRFTLTATEAGGPPVAPAPRIAAGGVAGAGGSVPPVKQISPNGLVSLYGENFAPAGTLRAFGTADLVDGRVPTKLAGVCVKVGAQFAPILLVSPGQLNIQAPSLTGSGDVTVQVFLNCGESSEVRSNVETVTLQAATPEFLYFVRKADGKNPIAAINAITGALIGAPGLIAGATFTPAQPGDILTLFATGFGMTDPAFQAGQLPDKIAPVAAKVKVVIGTLELDDFDVLYAGVTPTYAGLYQANLRIPANAPEGDLQVVVRVGAFSSPPGPYVTVRK